MVNYPNLKELVGVLMRLGTAATHKLLREKIDYWSLRLLEDVAQGDFGQAMVDISVLKEVLEFGRGIYEIEPINVEIVLTELNKLNAAIRQRNPLPDLPDCFAAYNDNDDQSKTKDKTTINGGSNDEGENALNTVIRQSSILEKIRQKANCQLRDLMNEFPDVSERTIRYDLQKLFNQRLIGRFGNGPSTYYVIK